MGILTVGVVTKPFHFESGRRMRARRPASPRYKKAVDTLIIIPNQNLFRVVNEKTTVADAFAMADQVLCSGVACITDRMVKEGLVNLDFANVCSIIARAPRFLGPAKRRVTGGRCALLKRRWPIRSSRTPR